MKRLMSLFLFLFLVSASMPSLAEETRIAVVDFKRLMDESPQAKQASDLLEKEFAPRESELSAEAEAIRKLEEDLSKAELTMTASKRAALEEEIIKRRRDFKQKSNNFKEDLNLARNRAIESLQRLVYKAALDVSKADGYDLLLAEGVVYASERIDITQKVLDQLSTTPQ